MNADSAFDGTGDQCPRGRTPADVWSSNCNMVDMRVSGARARTEFSPGRQLYLDTVGRLRMDINVGIRSQDANPRSFELQRNIKRVGCGNAHQMDTGSMAVSASLQICPDSRSRVT